MYICIYIYIYTHIYRHIYIYIYIYVITYVYIYIYTYVTIYIYIYICIWIYAYIHTYMYNDNKINNIICIYTYMCVYIYIYTHTSNTTKHNETNNTNQHWPDLGVGVRIHRTCRPHARSMTRKGGWYGWKPSSSSNLSTRVFRVYPPIESRQTASYVCV